VEKKSKHAGHLLDDKSRSLHLHILRIGSVELLKISGSNQVVNEAVMRNVLKVSGLEHGHKKHFSEFPAEICQILLIKCQCILFYVGSEVLKMVVMKSSSSGI
jgi:hypothetical protein